MHKTVLAAMAVAAAASLAAGCGGGGGGGSKALTKAEYDSSLNKICVSANTQIKALNLTSMTAVANNGDKILSIYDVNLEKARKLTPPDEIKDAAKRFVDATQKGRDDAKTLIDAAKAGDQKKFNDTAKVLAGDSSAQNNAAREIGATDCIIQ
jgi:hypothetical protein